MNVRVRGDTLYLSHARTPHESTSPTGRAGTSPGPVGLAVELAMWVTFMIL